MKVLILGGCGMSGSVVATDLVSRPKVSQVMLLDKAVDLGKLNTKLRTSPKVTNQEVDITDYKALVQLMKDRLFSNTAGGH